MRPSSSEENHNVSNMILTNTTLGWIVFGTAKAEKSHPMMPLGIHKVNITEQTFEKFWEIEDVPALPTAKFSEKELKCEQHYSKTTIYTDDGRPSVSLPFDEDSWFLDEASGKLCPDIGQNLQKALRQFLRNEKRLLENPEAHAQYVDFSRCWT